MSTTYLGEVTIGAMIPGVAGALVAAQSGLEAQLAAMIAMQAQLVLPSTMAELIAIAQQILAALNQLLALGLSPPTLNIQAAAILEAIATIRLQLQIYIELGSLLATGGVFAYVYDGPTNGAGGELSTALAGGFPGHSGSDHCNLIVMGATAGVTWDAMQGIFLT